MGQSMPDSAVHGHRKSFENLRPQQAKAHLKPLETDTWRADIAGAFVKALSMAGLTPKEFAWESRTSDEKERDLGQISRWMKGTERPQLDVIFAVKAMRLPMVLCLAELSEEITVKTTLECTHRKTSRRA